MLLLWWRRLLNEGLRLQVMDDRRGQWYVMAENAAGKRWIALGPFEERLEAFRQLRAIERLDPATRES